MQMLLAWGSFRQYPGGFALPQYWEANARRRMPLLLRESHLHALQEGTVHAVKEWANCERGSRS
jgi:hypothetical protein